LAINDFALRFIQADITFPYQALQNLLSLSAASNIANFPTVNSAAPQLGADGQAIGQIASSCIFEAVYF
jgi:hypothetical protein